ncbi:Uncharacterized protein OBRU01_16195, partial [Operophtera brumata]
EGLILDGVVGLVNARPIQEFQPDAAGFESLLEEEYKAISDVDKAFVKFVKAIPQSVYNHFHHVLYWYRLSLQSVANGTSSREQEQLVNVVNSYDVSVPSCAAAYLAGLGDFEDVTGVKHRMVSTEPNDLGHFGRATAQTHNLYESSPAPAISLQRVLEDLQYTLAREHDPIWDIPAITPLGPAADQDPPLRFEPAIDPDVQPQPVEDEDIAAAPEEEPNAPQARILDKNQLSELRNLFEEIPEDVARTRRTIPRYAYNPELFELALRRIKEVNHYKLVPLPVNRGGSVAQQLIWDPEPEQLGYLERQSAGQGAISSHTKIHTRVATIAK